MSDPIDMDSEGNPLTLMDIISVNDTIADDLDIKIKVEQLKEFVEAIQNPREKFVIVARYGLFGHKRLTQREIAKQLDISRSYVSRLEKKTIQELRNKFEKKI